MVDLRLESGWLRVLECPLVVGKGWRKILSLEEPDKNTAFPPKNRDFTLFTGDFLMIIMFAGFSREWIELISAFKGKQKNKAKFASKRRYNDGPGRFTN